MSEHWTLLDVETPGLKDDDELLELAAHHVDPQALELIGTGFSTLIVHPEEPPMDEKVRTMHQNSGLLRELQDARAQIEMGHVPEGCVLNYSQLDYKLSEYLQRNSMEPRKILLVGNTVSFDWGHVKRKLPRSFYLLSHRVIDVSVFRSQWQAWIGELVRGPVAHRAVDDITMSLGGLRWQKRVIEAGVSILGAQPDGDFARSAGLAKPGDSPL